MTCPAIAAGLLMRDEARRIAANVAGSAEDTATPPVEMARRLA